MNVEKYIIDTLQQSIDQVKAIYLFGSTVTKETHQASDIDIALVAGKKLDPVKLWYLAQEMAYKMGTDVDLVDLNSASTVFRFQVINTGKRIFCSDSKTIDRLENTWDSMYLRFNEERKEILEDYVA
jgi:predicted nucleotidyltransferase